MKNVYVRCKILSTTDKEEVFVAVRGACGTSHSFPFRRSLVVWLRFRPIDPPGWAIPVSSFVANELSDCTLIEVYPLRSDTVSIIVSDQNLTEREESSQIISCGVPPIPTDDPVNHPQHYTSHPSGIECIEVTRHFPFNEGNVIKYLWRAAFKGHTLQDLKKARWYLDDSIKQMEANEEKQAGDAS